MKRDEEKDYKEMRKVTNFRTFTSIRKMANMLQGLNYYPIIVRKIMDTLKENMKEKQKDIEIECEMQKEKERKNFSESEETETIGMDFVIDASVMGHLDLGKTISEIFASKSRIIVTSVTLRELEAMQMYKDRKGLDARKILAENVEKPSKFKNVLIDETLPTPDDCIVEYCAENRDKVTLLTADKTMVLKARMYEVKVRYLKHIPHNTGSELLKTLKVANYIDDKLIIDDFNKEKCNIMVISQRLRYVEGYVELKVGDHVYVGWIEEPDHVVIFEHYQVSVLAPKNNSVLLYSRKIYNQKGIKTLPKSEYKNFMREFFMRHDLLYTLQI